MANIAHHQNSTTEKVLISNVEADVAFSIDNTSSAIFDIISDKLYTNKITSIVRELLSNAIDAHKKAGTISSHPIIMDILDYNETPSDTLTLDTPIKNYLNKVSRSLAKGQREFLLRDFGTGLSLDDMKVLYTTYGASTKRASNSQIGGFGIGSKLPFAYTNQFYVRSIFDGMSHHFLMFKDERGFPQSTHLSSTQTDEEPGLEIRFAVKEGDVNEFLYAMQEYSRTFYEATIVRKNLEDYTLNRESLKKGYRRYIVDAQKGIYFWSSIDLDNFNESQIKSSPFDLGHLIMGGVPYEIPYDLWEGVDRHTVEFAQDLIGQGVLEVRINTIPVSASREELKIDTDSARQNLTILRNKVIEFTKEFHKEFISKVFVVDPTISKTENLKKLGQIKQKLAYHFGSSYNYVSLEATYGLDLGHEIRKLLKPRDYETTKNSVLSYDSRLTPLCIEHRIDPLVHYLTIAVPLQAEARVKAIQAMKDGNTEEEVEEVKVSVVTFPPTIKSWRRAVLEQYLQEFHKALNNNKTFLIFGYSLANQTQAFTDLFAEWGHEVKFSFLTCEDIVSMAPYKELDNEYKRGAEVVTGKLLSPGFWDGFTTRGRTTWLGSGMSSTAKLIATPCNGKYVYLETEWNKYGQPGHELVGEDQEKFPMTEALIESFGEELSGLSIIRGTSDEIAKLKQKVGKDNTISLQRVVHAKYRKWMKRVVSKLSSANLDIPLFVQFPELSREAKKLKHSPSLLLIPPIEKFLGEQLNHYQTKMDAKLDSKIDKYFEDDGAYNEYNYTFRSKLIQGLSNNLTLDQVVANLRNELKENLKRKLDYKTVTQYYKPDLLFSFDLLKRIHD